MLCTVTLLFSWLNKFQHGGTSVFDEPRPGAPKTAITEVNVTKIHDLLLADLRLKVREIQMERQIFVASLLQDFTLILS